MDRLLSIVEEQPSVEIDGGRLRQFLSRVKVWDIVKILQLEYQSLPATERFSILKDYYKEMCNKYSSGIQLFCFYFFLFIVWIFDYVLSGSDVFFANLSLGSPSVDFGIDSAATPVIKKTNILMLT